MTTEATNSEKIKPVLTPVRVRPPDEQRTELATTGSHNPSEMMVLAIQHGADPAVLQKLLELQKEYDAMQAKKAYVSAMADFKRDCPNVLHKDAEVDFTSSRGRTHYKHATLGGIIKTITPILSAHGLSISFQTEQNAKSVTVTCHVTHCMGHRESTALSGPQDESGNKNLIQAVGSAVTYLQRYTLLAALGLATADQDDDGFAAEVAARGSEAATKAADVLNQKRREPAAQPAPEPGENQERVEPNIVSGQIEKISEKGGGTKEEPWTKVGVQIAGEWYGTFDTTHGQVAKDAKENGQAVEIEWLQHGKYKNLVGIRVLADE